MSVSVYALNNTKKKVKSCFLQQLQNRRNTKKQLQFNFRRATEIPLDFLGRSKKQSQHSLTQSVAFNPGGVAAPLAVEHPRPLVVFFAEAPQVLPVARFLFPRRDFRLSSAATDTPAAHNVCPSLRRPLACVYFEKRLPKCSSECHAATPPSLRSAPSTSAGRNQPRGRFAALCSSVCEGAGGLVGRRTDRKLNYFGDCCFLLSCD